MGIPLLGGRDFAASDTNKTRQVAVISEGLARQLFSGESPIGRELIVRLDPPYIPWQIIGVVGDIRGNSLDEDIRPSVWIPHTQFSPGHMSFILRTNGNPLALAGALRETIRALDPELPVTDVMTMDDVVAKTMARPRIVATLLSIFAVMALLLAGVGVYGVMAWSVAQRTQEMGIRIALGASRSTLIRNIFGEALALAAIGLSIGLGGAFALARMLRTVLAGITTDDPAAFAGVTALLGATALIASFVPAWRAASSDPLIALRVE
jgi:predicted permease